MQGNTSSEEPSPNHLTALESSNLRAQNNKRWINRLPPELLTRIFTVGDEEQRVSRILGSPYYGFQDLAVRVCSHWRSVAINCPTLWTYIYISRRAPHDLAAVYLTRSGSTPLLDLDLDMMGNFFGDFGLYHWSSRVSSLKGSIEFLVQKGASINRWRSLVVRAEIPQVLYKTLEYISPESAPSLRFLSFKWKPCGGPETIEREDQSLEDFTTLDQGFPSSSDQFPQLRTVQFTAVPADFLLRRPLPMFVGLVHLKLISASRWFPLPKLHALFSANLQLESLSLGASFAVGNLVEVADCQVTLPFLRSLALAWEAWDEMSLLWALGIIKMIDGPVVEHLELASVGSSNEELLRLTKQIAPSAPKNGKVGTPSRPPSDQTPCRSIYPTLRYLNITKLEPANGCDEAFQALLSALPTITSLAAPHSALDLLGRVPWLLPRLERIRFFGCPPEELGSILSRRMDDGSPLKTLEIPGIYLQSICGSWARSLNIVKLPATEAAEYYESDDDDDDEEEEGYDDDDEGTDLGDFSEGDSGEDFLEDHYDSFGVDSYEAAMESAWQRFQAEQDWEDGEVDGEEEHDDGESGEGEGEDGEGDEEGDGYGDDDEY